jgi:tetratricopeptide (TPR) repeat protein
VFVLFVFAGGILLQGAESPKLASAEGPLPGYAGSSSCQQCHQHFYGLWAGSHHGLAMQPWSSAFAKQVLRAQGEDLEIRGVRYRVELAQGEMIEGGAKTEKRYRIAQVMGGKNVFYFLTPLDRGRLQVLPLGYDVRRQEWFDVAASAVRHFAPQPDAALDWRESPFTFNTACFNCHVSQLSNNSDLTTDTYHTTWTEPGINCETCHGPAAAHVQRARATPQGQPVQPLGLIATSSFSADQMNSLCGSCHAKMSPLSTSFSPGAPLYDHCAVVGLEQLDFYPDGRDLGENFTWTTWRLSPCLKSSQLDCLHCHTSSGRYRFAGETANQACLPCHASQVQNAAAHAHHKAGTPAATCVSCHMPVTEFARMRRTDHSMRPPAPAASLAFGSPNACNLCHADKDAAWTDQAVRQWQERDYQAPLLQRARWVAAARKQDWSALPSIIDYLAGLHREEVWAASLVQLLRPCDDERKWKGILPCLADPSPWVRAAAVDACADQLRSEMIGPLVAATRDSSRWVRIRAAAALAAWPLTTLSAPDRASLAKATDELQASLLARPDDSSSHYNLGNFYLARHDFAQAIAAFRTASQLDPKNVAPWVNASLAYNALGKNDGAEDALRHALTLDPTNAVASLNFGMLQAELGKPDQAEKAFRTAFTSDPQSAAAAYNLGVLLAAGHPDEALVWCRRAAELRPQDPKYAYTLAFSLAQQQQPDQAARVLEKALDRGVVDADCYLLLGALYQRSAKNAQVVTLWKRAAADTHLSELDREQFARRVRSGQER